MKKQIAVARKNEQPVKIQTVKKKVDPYIYIYIYTSRCITNAAYVHKIPELYIYHAA